jgi:hypothetical protein
MKEIVSWLNESAYIVPLSPACKMCADGSKLVVLVTGLCPARCFYCPISFKKGGTDCVFADEWELENEDDTEKLIQEAKYIHATGAGITGGDPLVVWERVTKYISLLKDTFGSNFHIHLYTSGIINKHHVKNMVSAGLDELRFHPLPKYWADMKNCEIVDVIGTALDTPVDVALEIPAIPGLEPDMWSLVTWAADRGVQWVNINELEYSERNAETLNRLGYTVKDDISAAVKGSQESANTILTRAAEQADLRIGVHYCSASFKDGVQLTNRIKRRALSIARDYETINPEGTLLKGIITTKDVTALKKTYQAVKQKFHIPNNYIRLNQDKQRIETGIWILKNIAGVLKQRGIQCYIVEEYPTADQLEVERTPL